MDLAAQLNAFKRIKNQKILRQSRKQPVMHAGYSLAYLSQIGDLGRYEFQQNVGDEYTDFARRFTRIKAEDIGSDVDAAYDSEEVWPHPMFRSI